MATTNSRLAAASLEAMQEAGVHFALLHELERLLRGDLSDVDAVVGEPALTAIRRTTPAWRSRGILPVLVWPYDIGGTATVFLATVDASEGAQLDLLFDPRGVGKYAVKSAALLATADRSGMLPTVSDAASLIYQWRKRTVKGQWERLPTLSERARHLDRRAVLTASETISGSSTLGRELLEARPQVRGQRLRRHLARRGLRIAQRLVSPVGFWAHAADADLGEELAGRFSRFLVRAATEATPSRFREPAWWAMRVMPTRLRPGVFVSTGRLPRWRIPDGVLRAETPDGAARQLTEAMAARVALRQLRLARQGDGDVRQDRG
jgi:hypothetical protein